MMLPAPYTATATTYIAGDASDRAAMNVANGIATAHVRVAAMNALFKSQLSSLKSVQSGDIGDKTVRRHG